MNIQALLMSASVAALGLYGTATAQNSSTGTDEDSADRKLDVVVITAERRDENLLTAPISASVLSGDDLDKLGVVTVDQLQFATPGAVVNNFGQGIDFNIRGIGKAEHNTQTTTGVITYRDGVATFPGYFTAEPYYDIASVEVLRGPQGTFVGQNATGGAVFVTSNNPKIDGGHHGYLLGRAGNYNDVGLQGAVNLPLADKLAARVAFNLGSRDSFYDIKGDYTGDDGVRIGAVRLGVLWEPTSELSVLFKTDYNYLDLSGYPADPVNATNDPFEISLNADMKALDRFVRSTLKVDYEFGNGILFRAISGFQKGNTAYRTDLDGTAIGINTFRDSVDETIYSQEFNLISPETGRLSWIVGAYLQTDKYEFLPGAFVIGIPPGNIFSEYVLEGTNPKQTSALFGQISYDLTDKLQLQVGARYSESKTSNDLSVMQYGTPIEQKQTAKFDNVSGKVALNYTLNDHNFLYAFAATGHRPGGLNVPVGLGPPDPFDEELVTNYEIGWKAGWLDGHVRTQFDVYHNEYDNFQVSVGYPDSPVFGIELNAPETTKITGLEAQVEAIFGNFSMDGGLGWMKSELGTFYATDPRIAAVTPCDPETGPDSLSCINLDGREQTYAPEFTFNIGVEYEFDLENGDVLTPRLNYGHVAEQWATLFENEALGDRVEDRNILSGQIAWVHGDIVATLYGTNLTDQHYVAAINSGARFVGPPRQFGVRLMKTF